MQLRPLDRPGIALTFALVGAVFLSSCSNSQTQTYDLPNGLKVTPITVEKSDVTDILDMKMYRFNVTFPKPGQSLDCNLELRRKGQKPDIIGGVGSGPFDDSQSEILVGLHPVDSSWGQSDQLKTFVRVGSGSSSGNKKNPFKRYSLGFGSPYPQQDGSFVLMVGSKNKSAEWPLRASDNLASTATSSGTTPTATGGNLTEANNDIALVVTFTPRNIKDHRLK